MILLLSNLVHFAQAQVHDRDPGPREPRSYSRIKKAKDPHARCTNTQGVSQNYCEKKRKSALASGCITKDEYQDLLRFGSTPSCDEYLALEKINSLQRKRGLSEKKFSDFTDAEKLQQLITWCPCGCFHPGSNISVVIDDHFDTKKAGTIAKNPKKYELLHLRADSSKEYFTYSSSPIRIATKGKEEKPLFYISLEENKTLRLTENHPVLLPNMKMVFAKNIKAGMRLVKKDGATIKVLSVKKKIFKGDVVNFVVDSQSEEPLEHVIFSEGIAVGDMYWQSEMEHQIDRIKVRL